jgi:hypothetical protein
MTMLCRGRSAGRIALFGAAVWLAMLSPLASARADVITDVNTAMLNIIQNTSASLIDGPPEVANEIQMVDSAMFDAVNAATGSTFSAINYTGGAVAGADANAAALSAAVTVMNNLYVNAGTSLYQQYEGVKGSAVYGGSSPYANDAVGPSATQMTAVLADVASVASELSALGNSTAVTTGTTLGAAAGAAAIAQNNASGSAAAMVSSLTPPTPTGSGTTPGVYVPPASRPELGYADGGVAPVGMTSAQLAGVEATIPAALASNPTTLGSSTYAAQVFQTECQGSGTALPANIEAACTAAGFPPESAAEAQAALFWNDPGGTLQPPGHWLQIADTVTSQEGLSLLQTAEATALAAIAQNDAGIGVWALKYQYNQWRPITAIRDCADNWNSTFNNEPTGSGTVNACDASWTSLIATPPHPDYLAGHPGFSGAAATALADILGDNVTFVSTSNAYCNAGTASVDNDGYIMGCTVGINFYSIASASCANSGALQYDSLGTVIGCLVGGTFTSGETVSDCQAADGTLTYDGSGNYTGCTVGATAETVTGGGCNNADSQPVLNPDGSANLLYNGNPLICPIAETFTSLSEASGGFLGAEFSRVVGGIHTPDAVTGALALGDAIGNIVTGDEIPEPPMIPVLAGGLLALGLLHRRRLSRPPVALPV